MAKNYNDIYNSVYVTGNKMDWTNAMIRGNGIPLDIYSVFDEYNKAVFFAATNAVAYEGQVLAVTENGDTTVYVITPAKQGTVMIDEQSVDVYLKEVGKATSGDDKTIVLNDGVLSLKNFGVEYYAYDDENKSWKIEATKGWVEGLQPKVINSGTTDEPVYEIAWFEPSSTTVEGLSETVGTLTERIATAEGTIKTQATSISDNATAIEGLGTNKADKATTLEGYGITDAYTRTEIDGKLSGAFHFRGEVNYYSDLTSKTDMSEGDVYIVKYIGTEGEIPLNAEYAYDGTKWVEFGSIMDLSGYATKTELGEVVSDINDINNVETGILATAKGYTDEREVEIKKDITANAEAIDVINNESTGILKQAKDYADGLNTAMDTRVSANTTAIDVINNAETGILKQSKDYTDEREVEIRKGITANTEEINKLKTADTDNLKAAKDYADGLNTAMDTRVSANTTAIDAINNAETGILKQAKDDATSKDNALKTELTGAIDTAKTGAINDSKAYTDERETEIRKDISANTTAIDVINNAETGILKQAKDDATSKDNALKAEITTDIGTAKTEAINESKSYTDSEIGKINESINTKVSQLETADTNNLAEAKAYTDEQVATVASTAANAMKYKGTVGEGGTVTELPTVDVKNGDTYKVLVDGTYDGQQAFSGDVFIAVVTTTDDTATIAWTLIPAGDDGNVNTIDTILTDGSLVIGKGNKEITTLANGTEGQILKIVDGKPSFANELKTVVSSDSSIDVEESTEGSVTTYTVSVKSVSTDLLTQGAQVLIFDGGNSIVEAEDNSETA